MPTLRVLVPAALLVLSPALLGQRAFRALPGELVAADLLGEPDTLVSVHSFGPNFMSPSHPFLSTPVNYLRGLEFDTPDSGYFVSGYTENGGPTGFFRFQNGQVSRVAQFPLARWGSLADTAWSQGRDFLWYVWDPAGAQMTTLYKIGLDGAFTAIGEMHYSNGVRVDIEGGLALDRKTGVLYGYDQNRAKLITIDPTTVVATEVGSSGLAPYPNFVVMSMDFSLDGRLFLMRNFGNLFEVDTATGQATAAGEVDTLCSAMAFAPARLPVRDR